MIILHLLTVHIQHVYWSWLLRIQRRRFGEYDRVIKFTLKKKQLSSSSYVSDTISIIILHFSIFELNTQNSLFHYLRNGSPHTITLFVVQDETYIISVLSNFLSIIIKRQSNPFFRRCQNIIAICFDDLSETTLSFLCCHFHAMRV